MPLFRDSTTSMVGWWAYWQKNILDVPRDRPGRPTSLWLGRVINPFRLIAALDIAPAKVYEVKPAGQRKGGPLPVHPMTRENAFIVGSALLPIALQAAWYLLFPNRPWPAKVATLVYAFFMAHFMTVVLRRFHYYMALYGVFDEANRGRDLVSDAVVDKLGFNIMFAILVRALECVLVAYKSEEFPTLSLSSIPRIMLFEIALDYYFYCYHRASHQVPALWWVHSRHHMTRHPTPGMTALADETQEVIEIIIVPLLAYATVPLKFHEYFIASCYLVYGEAKGHSGVRAYWPNPLLGPVLKPFDADISIEDHDLHHRFGRSGLNFGKRTRIFDRLFDTVCPRIEGDLAVDDGLPPEMETKVVDGHLEPTGVVVPSLVE